VEKKRVEIGVFEVLCLFTVIVSFTSLVLLSLHKFSSYSAIGIALLIIAGVFIIYRKKISFRKIFTRTNLILVAILLLALVFRYEPYLSTYTVDKEDQKAYLEMSEVYVKTGGPFVYDPIKLGIQDPYVLKEYNRHNFWNQVMRNWSIHQRLPGIYGFRFFPITSLWMSIFSEFSINRAYAIVFFSLLSIAALFLILLELGGIGPAVIIGVLVSVNPLHAYLSKTPLAEMTALAFAASGFYFMLRYLRSKRTVHILLFAGLIGCLFFTRITGFIYIPFFLFLLAATVMYAEKLKRNLILAFISVIGLYLLSILYGNYLTPLYMKQVLYVTILRGTLGSNWKIFLMGGTLLFLAFLGVLELYRNVKLVKRLKNGLYQKKNILLLVFFCCIVLYSIYKGHYLGMADTPNIDTLLLYLTIPLFILIFPAIYKAKDSKSFYLCVLLVIFSLVLLPRTTLYQYYYARRLLTLLVLCLLLASLLLWQMIKKTTVTRLIAYAILIFVVLNFTYYSAHQLKLKTVDGAAGSFTVLKNEMGQNDLLVIDKEDFRDFLMLKGMLNYYYSLKTFAMDDLEKIRDPRFMDYFREFDRILILSQNDMSKSNITIKPALNSVMKITYEREFYEHKKREIPTNIRSVKIDHFVYELDKAKLTNIAK